MMTCKELMRPQTTWADIPLHRIASDHLYMIIDTKRLVASTPVMDPCAMFAKFFMVVVEAIWVSSERTLQEVESSY